MQNKNNFRNEQIKNFDENILNEKIEYFLGKYNFDDLLIQESNLIIDEILRNLKKYFFYDTEEESVKDEFKISNFTKNIESKYKIFSKNENNNFCNNELRSFKNSNFNKDSKKINIKPPMRYNKFQKT